MIRLEPGKRIRRLVAIGGVDYTLELTAGGVALRLPRKRRPVAVLSLGLVLAYGATVVRRVMPRARKTAPGSRSPKRRRKASTRRRRTR